MAVALALAVLLADIRACTPHYTLLRRLSAQAAPAMQWPAALPVIAGYIINLRLRLAASRATGSLIGRLSALPVAVPVVPVGPRAHTGSLAV